MEQQQYGVTLLTCDGEKAFSFGMYFRGTPAVGDLIAHGGKRYSVVEREWTNLGHLELVAIEENVNA